MCRWALGVLSNQMLTILFSFLFNENMCHYQLPHGISET